MQVFVWILRILRSKITRSLFKKILTHFKTIYISVNTLNDYIKIFPTVSINILKTLLMQFWKQSTFK